MPRISGNKSTKYIYIFCEGETEKKYFDKIKQIYRISYLKLETIDLEGGTKIMEHPEWVKRKILETIRHNNPKIKGLKLIIFIVFDLDIFIDKSKLQNAQNTLRDYELIYNNECFEYWILSHFKKYDLGLGKKKYLDEIRKFLPKLPEGKDYKMTGNEDYNWLDKEKIKIAIKHTKEVNDNSTGNLKDRDPYSDVYKIIEFIES